MVNTSEYKSADMLFKIFGFITGEKISIPRQGNDNSILYQGKLFISTTNIIYIPMNNRGDYTRKIPKNISDCLKPDKDSYDDTYAESDVKLDKYDSRHVDLTPDFEPELEFATRNGTTILVLDSFKRKYSKENSTTYNVRNYLVVKIENKKIYLAHTFYEFKEDESNTKPHVIGVSTETIDGVAGIRLNIGRTNLLHSEKNKKLSSQINEEYLLKFV